MPPAIGIHGRADVVNMCHVVGRDLARRQRMPLAEPLRNTRISMYTPEIYEFRAAKLEVVLHPLQQPVRGRRAAYLCIRNLFAYYSARQLHEFNIFCGVRFARLPELRQFRLIPHLPVCDLPLVALRQFPDICAPCVPALLAVQDGNASDSRTGVAVRHVQRIAV